MRRFSWAKLASLPLLVVNVFIVGCGERIEYYDPLETTVVSNRADAMALVQLKEPKIKELVKSFVARGRSGVAWELQRLFEEEVRSNLTGLVDLELWYVKTNQFTFTKAGIDYVKTVAIDSRTPGMLSHFALFEYHSILSTIEDCVASCKYSEAQEWDRYLQKLLLIIACD